MSQIALSAGRRVLANDLRKKMGGMISHPAHPQLDQVYGRLSLQALRPCVAA